MVSASWFVIRVAAEVSSAVAWHAYDGRQKRPAAAAYGTVWHGSVSRVPELEGTADPPRRTVAREPVLLFRSAA